MMKKLFLSCISAMAFTLAVHGARPGENPTAKKIVDLNEYKGVLMYGATMLDASGLLITSSFIILFPFVEKSQ